MVSYSCMGSQVRALEAAARSRGGAKGWCSPDTSSTSPPPLVSPNNSSNASASGSSTLPGSSANSRGSFRNQTSQSPTLAAGGSFDQEVISSGAIGDNSSSNGNDAFGYPGQSAWYTDVTSSAFDGPRNAIRSTQHFGICRNESMAVSQFDLLWSLSDDVALSALAAHSASCRRESQSNKSGPTKLRKRPGELSGAAADAVKNTTLEC